MHVNGCHIVSILCADGDEGFSSTVTRDEVSRGPFLSIQKAVECARDWDKPKAEEANPPADAEGVLDNESPANKQAE